MSDESQAAKFISELVGYLALAVASLSTLLWRSHGKRCTELQEGLVPRDEFNQTTTALRAEMTRHVETMREEIREGYRHIENRIEEGNRGTHERIDRIIERRGGSGRG